jgi:hypothetical protein
LAAAKEGAGKIEVDFDIEFKDTTNNRQIATLKFGLVWHRKYWF